MIKVYKSKIVVFTRNWKTTFQFSLDFGDKYEKMYKWEDHDRNVICVWGQQPLKSAIKETVKYIANMITEKHCTHCEVPAEKDNSRCNKCGIYMSYKEVKY